MAKSLLDVSDLQIQIGGRAVVEQVGFSIARGETVVLVGESGSGKSLTALALVRLLPPAARITAGRIELDGAELLRLPAAHMRRVRGNQIGFIFQEPQSCLNPVLTIGQQIAEVIKAHRTVAEQSVRAAVLELLRAVGIDAPEQRYDAYAHQFSGGMKQRAMIAIALAGEPALLIADEPTTALDVTLQNQVLNLIKTQQRRRSMGILFITHDLGVAYQLADRVLVMRDGQIVESGDKDDFYASPQHPYSRALFAAVPNAARRAREGHALSSPNDAAEPILEVANLHVHFPIKSGLFKRTLGHVRAVNGVDLSIRRGETLAIVGESGSGKTTMGRGILRLLEPTAGRVSFRGTDVGACDAATLRRLRAALQVIFQDPYASMNPRMRVVDIIAEGLVAQDIGRDREERQRRVDALLDAVGLEAAHKYRYPHEFSGGQRQRICIARALAVEPELIVCDEPTSALDVSVQSQILALLRELQQQRGLAYLFITHNIGVVAYLAHRVAVMYRGEFIEQGSVDDVLTKPQHAYTQSLLAAVPQIGTRSNAVSST